MNGASARLTLLTPHGLTMDGADAVVGALAKACAGGGGVAAVLLRLPLADERPLIDLVKQAAPVVQDHGAALVVACAGFKGDLGRVAVRGGADGVHLDRAPASALTEARAALKDGRILGVGGIETRDAAMTAGEAGVDYVMFGGLYADGAAPDPETVAERAAWWAEIFETPCIAVATREEDIAALGATGAEFVGLESGLWLDDPEAVLRAGKGLGRP
ncbi:Thiamine-phosphate synthase [Methylobacterium jeotgali]|uniref:Thiamine-phosphate synthase n=3 Tax=Pseudomonadota TaxID=1224 RepID=A0ABQ4T4J7_9HYPH|nr:hypothetical protein AwMethylo_38070 [Methylobacterium sp.]GJE08841.1 Thiamine-phosphate synthase [Methylobacterium jeotgali]